MSNHEEFPQENLLGHTPAINYQMDLLPGIVGWVIGRSGCRIKYMQQICGCKMWIDQDVPDHQPRKLFLEGSENSIRMALDILTQVISEAPLLGGMYGSVNSLITRTIECPPELIGLLIGKKGWTIKKIQSDSGAQISINQSVREGCNRKIIVTGDQRSVEIAIGMIQSSIQTKSRRGEEHHVNFRNTSPDDNHVKIVHSNYHLLERRQALKKVHSSIENSRFVPPLVRNTHGRLEQQQDYSESDYIEGLIQRLNIGSRK